MTAQFATGGSNLILPGKPAPFFLAKGEGERAHLFDSLITVMLSKDETQGQFGFFSLEAPAGNEIPVHSHVADHETFYVAKGAVQVNIELEDGEVIRRVLEEGDFGYCPAGFAHSFQVVSHALMIGACTAGFERFFSEAGTATDSYELPNPFYIPTPERMGAAAAKYGNNFQFGRHLSE